MSGGTWTSTPKSTKFVELKVNSIYYDDIQCWFGDYVADDCVINNQGILVNGPNTHSISSGTIVNLRVETIRARLQGFTQENFQYPKKGDYAMDVDSTSKKIKVE